MRFDWTITVGNLVSIVFFIGGVVAAFYRLQRSFDLRFESHERQFVMHSTVMTDKFNELTLVIARLMEGDIRELRGRVTLLESGQSEWIKTLRDRTHDLADQLNLQLLRIDRLERPHHQDTAEG